MAESVTDALAVLVYCWYTFLVDRSDDCEQFVLNSQWRCVTYFFGRVRVLLLLSFLVLSSFFFSLLVPLLAVQHCYSV